MSDTRSFSQSSNSLFPSSNPLPIPHNPPSNLQRPRTPSYHPLTHTTPSTISPQLPSDIVCDESLSADGDVDDEVPDLSSTRSPYRRAHRRIRSEIEMPAARPVVNPASNLANARELMTSVVSEYSLNPEHKSAFERIGQMDQFTVLLHLTCRLMKVEELLQTAEQENYKEAPWFKNDIHVFCKDVLMHPLVPAYRLCGNSIYNNLIGHFSKIPSYVITNGEIKTQIRKAVLSHLNNWRFRAKQKIEMAVQEKQMPWDLANDLSHSDTIVTINHVHQAAVLRQAVILHKKVVDGSTSGRVIRLHCLGELSNSSVRLIMTGDFWTDIELFLLYLRKRAKSSSNILHQQKEFLHLLVLGFYKRDVMVLANSLVPVNPVLPDFVVEANSKTIPEHQIDIDKIIHRITGNDAALEKAALVSERHRQASLPEWMENGPPPVYYD